LEKNLEAYLMTDDVLAIFVKRQMIEGRTTRNPEMMASKMKIGTRSGNWLGVTSIREDSWLAIDEAKTGD